MSMFTRTVPYSIVAAADPAAVPFFLLHIHTTGIYFKPNYNQTMAVADTRGKRIKIACDECHARRVKCNGQTVCVGCHETGIVCSYTRPQQRRGGASSKQKTNFLRRRQVKAEERQTRIGSGSAALLPPPPSIASSSCRYPILSPILPSLEGIVSSSAACDILDTYFCRSAWGNSYLIRKASFLSPDSTRLRKTKPTLLYAMLCFASQYHAHDHLEVLQVGRGSVTDRLFELASSSVVSFHDLEQEATLDDVLSHIQLASILSASKYQKKSIEWWSATYQLARQLRLNEELPIEDASSAEEREERRRTWWLLYCVDRHQALSVRKSLVFRDAERHNLRHPCDDSLWNSPDEFTSPSSNTIGIEYKVTDCSFFGFFLPLMSILGEIIELYNFQELGRDAHVESQRVVIQRCLHSYDDSLNNYPDTSPAAQLYTCYARHTISTLYILSAGKWDPCDALGAVQESGLSEEQIYSAAMATVSASNIQSIQTMDAEFTFLPLFFGTFVLHCSFPLLLLAKTFGPQSDDNIIGACETIIHASTTFSRYGERLAQREPHPNRYLSNFISIIDGIKTAKTTSPETPDVALQMMQDIHTKTEEILRLYRWNKTGHGVNT